MVVEETKDLDHIRIRNRIQQDEHQTPAAHFAIWKNRNLQKSRSLSLSGFGSPARGEPGEF